MKHTLESLEQRIDALEGKKSATTIQTIPAKTLEWGAEAPDRMNWEEAVKWCESQGEGWRLPTITELYQAYWDKVEGFTQSNYYWSSTTYPASYTSAMSVDFNGGIAYNSGKANSSYVRCVRGLDI